MKCHVCEGEPMHLTNSRGYIKGQIQCPHCKGTHEEPFNAEAKIAELAERVTLLEKLRVRHDGPPKKALPERPWIVASLMSREYAGRILSGKESVQIADYIEALEKECGKC